AYIVEGEALAPAARSLGEVEGGTLDGALFSAEVSLSAAEHEEQHLGEGAAAVGDVNGDGFEDLLLAAPSFSFALHRAGRSYLVYGPGGAASKLRVERLEPDTVALAGGEELTLFGAGFGEGTEVRIGGAAAPVRRVLTSARIAVVAPPLDRTGPADVVATRGADTATLPGGARYVARIHPDVDVLELPAMGKGAIVRGMPSDFVSSLAFLDVDGDGFSDAVAANFTGTVVIVYGSAQPAPVLELPDLEGGQTLEGVSLIRAGLRAACARVGDVNGDQRPDLAFFRGGDVTVLFSTGRYPADTDLEKLLAEERGARILNGGPPILAVTGGGDIDGDGIGDLVVSVGDYQVPRSHAVFLVTGSAVWRQETFLEDMPRISTTEPEDYFGSRLAAPGDVDRDGRADILAGAPGRYYNDDGNGYLLFGGAWNVGGATTVQDLLAQGKAARLDAFKARDGIGYQVCAPGDLNGDGNPDLAISSQGGGVHFQGESYVVFGGTDLRKEPGGAVVSMASLGERGLRILGERPYDYGVFLAPAGDFDGDGLRDLLIGAPTPSEPEGKAYVVFGGSARTVRLYNLGADGFRLTGKGLFEFG
ncbi:MAG: hypothetical protein AUI36_19580, partial [Cyanobacteria bacterium 13_1_40CM_2_61_4]